MSLKGFFFSALDRLLKPTVPKGYRAGQRGFWPKDWSLEDAQVLGFPVVKAGVDNPLLPPRERDWGFALGAVIAVAIGIAGLLVFLGQAFDGDPWALFRDIAELVNRIF